MSIDVETALPPVSDETKTWAAMVIEQHRAVDALHRAEIRWQVKGAEDGGSWGDKDEALEAAAESGFRGPDGEREPATEADLSFFLVCAECSHIEESFAQQQMPSETEWGYESSLWPCRTAQAMGHTEETA